MASTGYDRARFGQAWADSAPVAYARNGCDLVQVDHVVALSDAWQKGGQRLDAARLEAFATDPLNLVAVAGEVNQAKGDGDAATWLPPNRPVRCAYVDGDGDGVVCD